MPLTQNGKKADGTAPQQFLLTASSGYRSASTATDRERATVPPSASVQGEKKIISVTLIALRFGSRHSLTHSLPAPSSSSFRDARLQ